jgi:hypothetical protein
MISKETKGVQTMMKFSTNVQCEEVFTPVTLFISDCCGEYMDSVETDHELCPCCHEHCEVITEEWGG